jgi:hypothetical protein
MERARENEGGLAAKILPTPSGMEKLGEENQLPQWSHWSRFIPLDMITTTFGID